MKSLLDSRTRSSFAVLFILSAVVSPFVAVLSSSNSYANSYKDMTAIGRIKAMDAITIFDACSNAGGSLKVSAGKATDLSQWSYNPADKYLRIDIPSYYDIEGDGDLSDNSVTCESFFQKYSAIIGISDPEQFLSDAGITFSGTNGHFSGYCSVSGKPTTSETDCLRGAIYSRMGVTSKPTMDAQMTYVRNTLILEAKVKEDSPGGCFVHWSNQTSNSGSFSINDWYNNNNPMRHSYPEGILGSPPNFQTINLVDDIDNPTKTEKNLALSEGGDDTDTDGWVKTVYTSPIVNQSAYQNYSSLKKISGSTDTCINLVNYLDQTGSAAYVAWKISTGSTTASGADQEQKDDPQETTTSCAIEGVGWIVCPVMNFLGSVTDGAYNFLADNFLATNTKLVSTKNSDGTESGVYTAWKAMRNIANIAFVIAFIIIIFSQLTSFGISNYGVKKMLPRLIVAAILVNASFFICQIAVDISNILGYSIKNIITGIPNSTASGGVSDQSGNGFGIATMILEGLAAGYMVFMAISIPVLLAVLLAVLMIALTLIGRTALIVILVVLSPIAFVAYLLPNTEQYFKKWYKLFYSLLLLFPIIGVVFGASTLASNIIASASDTASASLLGLIAVAVKALPLFVVPTLLKGALNGTGQLGAKVSGWSNKASQRASGKVKESRLGDAMRTRQQNAAIRRAKARGGIATGNPANPLRWGTYAGAGLNRLTNQFVPGGSKYATKAAALEDKEYEEGIAAAQASQKSQSFAAIKEMATSGTVTVAGQPPKKVTEIERTAAVRQIMERGSFEDRRALVETSASLSDRQRQAVSSGVMAKGDHKVYGAPIGDAILRGEINQSTLSRATENNIVSGKVDQATIARDAATAKYIGDVAGTNQHGLIQPQHKAQLVDAATAALKNPELSKSITPEHRNHIDTIQKL